LEVDMIAPVNPMRATCPRGVVVEGALQASNP
jgi:hypothetical protein